MKIDELLDQYGGPAQSPSEDPNFQSLMQNIEGLASEPTPDTSQTELEQEANTDDWNMGTARAVTEGLTLGWGDELGIALAAAGAKASGDERPWSELYKDMKGLYDTEQQQYKEQAPVASTVAEIGGSIASPAGWLGLPKKASILYTASRAGAEGAIYGAGISDNRTEGAMQGAAFGAGAAGVLGVAFKGLGKGADVLTSRKVELNLLDADGSFTPMTLAARGQTSTEDTLQSIYRDVVGVIPGGKRRLAAQADAVVNPVEAAVTANKTRLDRLNSDVANETKRVIGEMEDAIKASNAAMKGIKDPAERAIAITKELPKSSAAAANAAKSVSTMKNHAYGNFRLQGFLESFPVSGNTVNAARVEKALKEGNTYNAMRLVDNEWSTNGFNQFFGRMQLNKPIVPNELAEDIATKWANDGDLVAAFAGDPALKTQLKQMVDGLLSTADSSGVIDGKALGTVYSRIGTRANAAEGIAKIGMYRAQDAVTDVLEKNLSPADFKAFQKERGKWKSLKVLRDSVTSTSADMSKRGDFTPEDWLKAVKRNNSRDARQGSGPLASQARGVFDTVQSSEKAVVRRIRDNYIDANKSLSNVTKAEKSKLAAKVDKLQKEIDDVKKGVLTTPKAEMLGQKTKKLKETQKVYDDLSAHLERHKELLSVKNPTWFHQVAALGLLGSAVTSVIMPAVGIPAAAAFGATAFAGVQAAKVLAQPNVQRAVAGQLDSQQAVQRGLKKLTEAGAGDSTARAASRGMLTTQ